MTFTEYERLAAITAIYPNRGNNLYYPALGLGEVGEVQNNIKKVCRDDGGQLTESRKNDIKKELGDILWYIAAMCYECGFTMEEVAQGNIDKLKSRLERGTLEGSGDDR